MLPRRWKRSPLSSPPHRRLRNYVLHARAQGVDKRSQGRERHRAPNHAPTPPPQYVPCEAHAQQQPQPQPQRSLPCCAHDFGISAPHTSTNTERVPLSMGTASGRDVAAARRPGRAALCVCCAIVLAAVSQEADAQQTEEVSCPFDLPEGGWEEGQSTTRYCCKPIYWGRGPDLHRARARCQQTRCVLLAPARTNAALSAPSP